MWGESEGLYLSKLLKINVGFGLGLWGGPCGLKSHKSFPIVGFNSQRNCI